MTPGAVYRWSCGHCKSMGKQAQYYGETSRSVFERISEHHKQIQAGKDESPMVEHMTKHHSGGQMAPKYKVEMIRSFKKPMERQIFEGMRIRNSQAIPINRKGEWGQNLPPRFEIEEPKKSKFKGGGELTQTND